VDDRGQQTRDRSSGMSGWAWIALLVIALIILLLLLGYCRRTTSTSTTVTTTPTMTIPPIPEPTATAIPTGTPVSALTTPAGPTVPDVITYVEDRATTNLEQAGYGVSVSHVYSSYAKGRVFQQDPAPGTVAPLGTGVNITVSDGWAPKGSVRVPNVLGMSVSAAKSRISSAGLRPNAIPRPRPDSIGRIWDQYPPAGASAVEDSEVTLLYGMR
jgi:beta-lactam-binding protein with PASTA domain